ncbi:MAG: nickel-dependent lactate racemase [Chloroflexi bacterium]|nr:nickel-dependent lactate racemase [Chloroflexota bacterium]
MTLTDYSIKYGADALTFSLPDAADVTVIEPRSVAGVPEPAAEVERALGEALAGGLLQQPGKTAIAISDATRPVPNHLILPPLLAELHAKGVKGEEISIIVGTGNHRAASPDEFPGLVGTDVAQRYHVVSHVFDDPAKLVRLGETSRGTPVTINRTFAEADTRIIIGMIDPHQFVGYTGGCKGAFIGLAGSETITANHSMLSDPAARLGVCDGNPVREDIDELTGFLSIDLVVNVVLNAANDVVRVFAGDPHDVLAAAVPLVQDVCETAVPYPMDVVVASPGGYPKDINLYQAQKALAHACELVRPGGSVILAAECREGAGDDLYEAWMAAAESPQDVVTRFEQEGFRMGAHKAFLFARSMLKAQTYLVSSGVPPEQARRLHLMPAVTVEDALALALQDAGDPPRVGIMPRASSTIPRIMAPARI